MPGDFIREIIDKTGYTQKQIASRLKVTPGAVSDWTRSKYFPEISKLEELLKLLPHPVNVGDCFRLPSLEDDLRKIAREEARAVIEEMRQERNNSPPKASGR